MKTIWPSPIRYQCEYCKTIFSTAGLAHGCEDRHKEEYQEMRRQHLMTPTPDQHS